MSLLSDNEVRQSPLYEQMYFNRSKMSVKKRNLTRNKESTMIWFFPSAAERKYSIWISKEFKENIVGPVNKYVLDNYLLWLNETRKDSLHADGIGDILKSIGNTAKKAFVTAVTIISVGNLVKSKNAGQWDKFVKEATGTNINLYDPSANSYVQEWADLNKQYLSSLPSEYVNKISTIVSEGIEEGSSKKDISERIYEASKKFTGTFKKNGQSRADRIARDQVGKLNSALSRSRMSQAKLDIYKWATAADERVRGTPGGSNPNSKYSHYIMDQKYKQVDNAKKISDNGKDWRNVSGREEPKHAGQAINCRCPMIPSFIKLKILVDKDIRNSKR